MIKIKYILFVIVGCWISVHSNAQSQKMQFDHISGLSSNSATCILKDSFGFMWFGTIGLDRFDGYEVVNYRFSPEDKNSLKGNQIYKIFEDSRKFLWVCTDVGINRFNRETNNFSFFKLASENGSKNIILVHDVYQDSKGDLWIGTSNGLFKYDYINEKFQKEGITPLNGKLPGEIFSIFEDHLGNFWIGNHKRDLFIYNRNKKTLNKFLTGDFKTDYTGNRNEIRQIFEDSRKNIWILTNLTGVYLYTPEKKTISNFNQDFALTGKSVMINSVNSIIELQNGEIWVGAGGINIYDPKNGSWRYIQNDINNNSSISSNIAPYLYLDNLGLVWIATTDGGVDLYNPISKSSLYFSHIPFNKNSLSQNTVQDFYEDGNGIIWIGTDKGGLDRFDPVRETFTNYPANTNNPEMLSSAAVLCLEGATSGNIWVGVYAGGLHLFNPKTGKFIRYNYDDKNPNSIGGEHVWDIKTDPVTKNLWVGILWGNRGGLDEFIPEKQLFVHHSKTTSAECAQKHFSVTKIFCDSRKNVWVGSFEFGVDKYSKEQNCFKTYTLDINDRFSINSNHINDIFEDSKKRLWLATDNGINLYNYEHEYFMHFGNKEGMAGKEVQSILEDNNGNLWLATDKGISKFCLPSQVNAISKDSSFIRNLPGKFVYFKNYDGKVDFYGNEFRSAALKTSDGKLYFGGIKGFNVLNPSEMNENPNKPPVVITEFRLFNDIVGISVPGKKKTPLQKDILVTKELVLDHTQNVFSFKYVALNYSSPQKNQYAYIMEGFEKNWNYVGSQRIATYTNLPAGTYTFKVKASNDDLVWNEEGVSIQVTILPPWWKTIWFRILFISALLIAFYSWYLFRLATLKKQKAILEIKVRERTARIEEANIKLKDTQDEILAQKEELEEQNAEIFIQRNILEEKNKMLALQNEKIIEQNDKIRLYAEKIHTSDLQKIQFLTNISHEFRTPLSLIMDPTDRLLTDLKDKNSSSLLNLIKINTHRMLRLVNQILDIVKLDTGKYKLRLTPGYLMQTINNIVASFQYRASLKEIVISCDSFDTQIPAWYCTDAIEKITYNLLSNSIKHTKNKGHISLEIRNIQKNDNALNMYSELFGPRDFFILEIILKDTGIGIPKEYIDKIFDRFYQVESQTGRSVGGSGIGLSIVKEMTEMHGGTIHVESIAGEGTTFYIRFPVGKLNKEEINLLSKKNSEIEIELSDPEPVFLVQEEADDFDFPESEIHTLQKSTILVVEDDPDLKGYLISILLREYNVYGASNGVEGLQIARNDIPDLIISDVMMPEMSGIELCKTLKTDELTNHIPVILLTAKSSSLNIIEGLETGADDYITKPFESVLLLARVSNIIKIRQQLQIKHRSGLGNILISISGKTEEDPFLNRATEMVEKMLMENIDGEMLAREMAMSLRQLYRKIEATTNQTVNEFIRSVQLKKGAQLLIEGKHNISEVCYLTGMSNPRYFSTLFKKQFGMTPSEFVISKDELST